MERRVSIDQAVAHYEAAELLQARERIDALFGNDALEPEPDRESGAHDAEIAALVD